MTKQEMKGDQTMENAERFFTITATVDGVPREVQLTEAQMYPVHRILQDMYDQEDVQNILEERMFQDMKPEWLEKALQYVPEIAKRYREALDDDESWYNILQSVVLNWMYDNNAGQ